MFCVVVIFTLVVSCSGGALKDVDVELIPEEQITVGADVGKSLSLGLDGYERRRRDFVDVKEEEVEDQKASGSEFYAPVYVDYDEVQKKDGAAYKLEDVGDRRGEVGFYGAARQKGTSGRVSEGGYAGDHQAARGDRVNSGYYDDNLGARKAYDVGRASYGDQAYNRKGEAAAAIGSRGGHRKGHHSSGFKNSYYKDESGNNSRFYDDANDEGGHYMYDGRDGAYRDHGADAYRGGYEDGAYRGTARGKQGKYGAAAGYDDSRGFKGRYAQDDFYDDKAGYNQQRGGESYGKNLHGGRSQEAGSLYHKAGGGYGRGPYHGSYSYSEPTVVGGYVYPSGIYNYEKAVPVHTPKAYYPEASYPVPYRNLYKGKSDSGIVSDAIYDGDLKGKGHAEYVDTGASIYHSDKSDVYDRFNDEPDY